MWRQDKDGKCLIPDGEATPFKPDPMRNEPEIIKGISIFIEYWKELCEEDITRRVRHTHEPLIEYWDRIRLALMILSGNTYTILTQEFWPQSCLMVVESDTMFLSNGDVREEFTVDKYYVGPTRNRLAPLFRVGADCHEGIWSSSKQGMRSTPSSFG